ncbi:Glucose dehydrogenase [FAD, quinone] [Orchesella cincta]|uniref:Glucose dehydrogenase [FAD, quinone] n=1 Tax=Orchesella cincta TaxID=48709 RepID=A0A1D2M7Q6_ORCCI|nr:Glucose dehydrogenase [FAD, quinone] [Orchesella cincta]
MQSPVAQPSYPDLQLSQFSAGLYPELPQDFNSFLGLNATILNTWFHPYHLENRDARFLLLWLEHPDDIEALLYGFKKVVDLFENTRALNTSLFPNILPGCEAPVFKSDEYYRCVIRQFGGSFYHHVGTCALGKVVDNNLRVKGINGLRIIDASIIPRVPNGNTQAGVIMVAEKGVDLILQDFDEKKQFTANLNGKETETFKYLKQTLLHSSQNRVV